MKAVEVQISLEVLRRTLRLPDDVRFTKVTQTYPELRNGTFSVIVEGENLEPVGECQQGPWGHLVIHTEWCNSEERTHIIRGEVKAS